MCIKKTIVILSLLVLAAFSAYAQEGALSWSFKADGTETTPAIASDGTIYVGSDDNNLYAINPNGTLKWKYATGGDIEGSPVVAQDDSVYFVSSDNNLYALTSLGARKWAYALGSVYGNNHSILALSSSGDIVLCSGTYVISISQGGLLNWKSELVRYTDTGSFGYSATVGPVISSKGAIYAAGGGYVFKFDSAGKIIWNYNSATTIYSLSLTNDNRLLFGGSNKKMHCLSEDGELLWSFISGGAVYSSAATGPDGTIYFGSDDNKLYAVDQNGYYLWEYLVGDNVQCTPAVGSDGVIYFAAEGTSSYNGIYALNKNGSLRWEHAVVGNIYDSSPTLAKNGVLYFTLGFVSSSSVGGNVLAINVSSPAPAFTPWPMFGHDQSHTFRIPTPLDDNTEFVRQVFRDFLNREADAGGLSYWVGELNAGRLTRASLVEQYLLSPEFGEKVSPVTRLYFAYFNRLPDYSGLMYWVNEYASGNRTLNNISDAFAASTEFQTSYGSLNNGQFVDLIYTNLFNRSADPGGKAYWTSELDSGRRTRGQVVAGFSESQEYKDLMANPIYVTMTYIGLLRRAPEHDGFDYWVGRMDQGASGQVLIDLFLNSAEYAARFQ